jgi:hypothetical protein
MLLIGKRRGTDGAASNTYENKSAAIWGTPLNVFCDVENTAGEG